MKVLDLQCVNSHVFEGWFASEDDYQMQQAALQIQCPMCTSRAISKRLSAPRFNLGAAPLGKAKDVAVSDVHALDPERALQQQWLRACRHIAELAVDVGSDFAKEARKIHYGESTERAIRGVASQQETQSLLEEGIAVLPLSLPDGLTDTLQ